MVLLLYLHTRARARLLLFYRDEIFFSSGHKNETTARGVKMEG